MYKKSILGVVFISLLSAGGFFWVTQPEAESIPLLKPVTPTEYQLVATTSTIHVTGLVSAISTAIISAQTSGVLRSIAVAEGSVVRTGEVLSVQDTPVTDARLMYQGAVRAQAAIEQSATVDNFAYTAEKAAATARSADIIALLQTEAAASRMQEQLTSVRTEIESGVTTMLNSLTFIDNNKPLFSDNKQEQFRSIVNNLYGLIPNHFRGGIMYGNSADTIDVLDTLEDMRTIEVNDLAAGDVEMLGVIVMGQTQALLNLYTSAESTILDRDTIATGSDAYSTYFANRAAIIQALSQLESAQSSLQVKIDAIQATEAGTEQSVTITALDEEAAVRQAAFREEIAGAAAASAQAAQRVVAVERSLGTIVSPFPGVVSDTFKEVGEYVSAGEPLLTMVGAGGREVSVSVPVTLVDQVAVGSTFRVAGKGVGVVSRLSPVSSGHSIKVIIRLTDPATQVGISLSGELTITSAENSFLVPREYVFFNSGTAEVHDADGQIYPAQINYDNGDMFQLTFLSTIPTQPLVPSRSISFK